MLLLAGCALQPPQGRTASTAIQDTSGTRLARALSTAQLAHPQETGIQPLVANRDALTARVLLAGAAERCIDAQYYIWNPDHTGMLLLEELWKAAGRGVRIRLLLDDNSTKGMDPLISALAARHNFEVRLFNPLRHRHARWMNYLLDFRRVNHRMHNKSFTVDNQVAVMGGRNVGDEYLGAARGPAYADLDVLVVGPVVRAISDEFDLYWNSASAYPAGAIVGAPSAQAEEYLRNEFAAARADGDSPDGLEALAATDLPFRLESGQFSLEWVSSQLVYDDPTKALQSGDGEGLLLTRLLAIMARPVRQFDLVSPYFVPGRRGEDTLTSLARQGICVRVLTNSLESTDVVAVHAGYIRHRKALLRAGVQLYELQRQHPTAGKPRAAARHTGSFGSATSLHAKTFQMDGQRIFVGSFNFDPRSARINTEMGLVIDSTKLAARLQNFFDSQVRSLSYEVQLEHDGALRWLQQSPRGTTTYTSEPNTGLARRAEVRLLSWLPIEPLL